jgi:ABC-2 type transport system permease protein
VIRVELVKQLFRLRTYVALGIMAFIPVFITLAVEFGNRPSDPQERSFFAVATASGLNVPLAALTATSSFLLVIVVAAFAGAAVSEEANWGSLRYLLVRPVSRSRLLFSKLVVTCLLVLLTTIVITVSGLISGVIFFGLHPILTPNFQVFPESEAIWKITLSTLYVAWCMTGVIALAFMISTMTDTTLGAMAGAVGAVLVSHIINAIQTVGDLRHLLITHYWDAWEQLFGRRDATEDLLQGFLLQLPYIFVFLALSWWWFHRRDILS